MKAPLWMSVLVLSAMSSLAHAAGGRETGGGTFVNIDGETKLSDPFYQAVGDEHNYGEFREEIRNYISQVQRLLAHLNMHNAEFFSETIAGKRALYIMVSPEDEAKIHCPALPPLTRPVDAHFGFGCTDLETKITYLFSRVFTAPGVPIREQAKAIIHERLWAHNPKADQRFIAIFTTLADKLMARWDNQIFRGDRTFFSAAELKEVDRLQMAAQQLGFQSPDVLPYPISRAMAGGGGILGKKLLLNPVRWEGMPVVDARSFISLGSTILGDAEVTNSVLLNSSIMEVKMRSSKLEGTTLNDGNVEDSELKGFNTSGYVILQRARVRGGSSVGVLTATDSEIVDTNFGNSATLENAKMVGSSIQAGGEKLTYRHASVIDSLLWKVSLEGTPSAPIEFNRVKLAANSRWYFRESAMIPAGVRMEDVEINAEGLPRAGRYSFEEKSPFKASDGPSFEMNPGVGLKNVRIWANDETTIRMESGVQVSNLQIRNPEFDNNAFNVMPPKIMFENQTPLDFGGFFCDMNSKRVTIKTRDSFRGECK